MENERLVLENTGLVRYVVAKYRNMGMEHEDLIQTGMIGLVKAAKGFDGAKGVAFSSYAVRCIENEIWKMIKREKRYKTHTISLQTQISGSEEAPLTLEDVLGFCQPEYEAVERERILSECLAVLSEKERRLIGEFFFKGRKQEEIGKLFGCSQPMVSRRIKAAVRHMQRVGRDHIL